MTDLNQDAYCPFCDASIQASAFYRKNNFMAVYNIAPVLPGHSLVIPEKHLTSILDLSPEEFHEFFDTARNTLRILMKAFNTDSFDWSVQEKPEAGQTIEHLHLHIVPRLKHDLPHPGNWYPLVQQNDQDIIDSFSRPRLSHLELTAIVNELSIIAKEF